MDDQLDRAFAALSDPVRRAMVALAVDNLAAALGVGERAGRPPNMINADALLARGR